MIPWHHVDHGTMVFQSQPKNTLRISFLQLNGIMCQTMNKLPQIIVKKEFQSFNVKIQCISFCVISVEPLHARKKLEQQTLNHR